MTKQAKQTEPSSEPIERAGLRWQVWALFLSIVVLTLAVDLGLKYWSFKHVADEFQVQVRTAEGGGPEVLVRVTDEQGWLVAHEIGMTEVPSHVPGHDPIVVVPSLLNFQLTLNTGAVFGMGQGARPFFIIISILAVVVILFLLYRSPRKALVYQIALALILGGALGNLYDRVFYSAVRDMLHMLPGVDLPFGLAYPWGGTEVFPWIFNIADVVLLVGVGLVLLLNFTSEWKQKQLMKQKQAEK